MPIPLKRDVPPLLVRADADAARGAGHVMRCLALAQEWQKRGGRVTFIGEIPQPLIERIKSAGFGCRQITAHHPEPSDLYSTLSVLDDVDREIEAAPWVLLDGYNFDPTYQGMLRAAGARVIVVDDTANCPYYDADLILNHAINAERLGYNCAPDAMLLLGTRYALLRS